MRLHKFIVTAFTAAAATVGLSQLASAADIPSTAQATARAPAIMAANWTGFYLGAQGGYGWGNSSQHQATADTGDYRIKGGVFGGTLGYNVQMRQFVFGVESDLSWSGIKGTTGPGLIGTYGCFPGACETKVKWFGSLRGRLGFAVDRALIYGTGGWAFGSVSARIIGAEPVGFAGTSFLSGWTLGGGLEWGFTRNMSAKIEYLYTDLGTFTFGQTGTGGVGATATAKFNVIRAGLNFRF